MGSVVQLKSSHDQNQMRVYDCRDHNPLQSTLPEAEELKVATDSCDMFVGTDTGAASQPIILKGDVLYSSFWVALPVAAGVTGVLYLVNQGRLKNQLEELLKDAQYHRQNAESTERISTAETKGPTTETKVKEFYLAMKKFGEAAELAREIGASATEEEQRALTMMKLMAQGVADQTEQAIGERPNMEPFDKFHLYQHQAEACEVLERTSEAHGAFSKAGEKARIMAGQFDVRSEYGKKYGVQWFDRAVEAYRKAENSLMIPTVLERAAFIQKFNPSHYPKALDAAYLDGRALAFTLESKNPHSSQVATAYGHLDKVLEELVKINPRKYQPLRLEINLRGYNNISIDVNTNELIDYKIEFVERLLAPYLTYPHRRVSTREQYQEWFWEKAILHLRRKERVGKAEFKTAEQEAAIKAMEESLKFSKEILRQTKREPSLEIARRYLVLATVLWETNKELPEFHERSRALKTILAHFDRWVDLYGRNPRLRFYIRQLQVQWARNYGRDDMANTLERGTWGVGKDAGLSDRDMEQIQKLAKVEPLLEEKTEIDVQARSKVRLRIEINILIEKFNATESATQKREFFENIAEAMAMYEFVQVGVYPSHAEMVKAIQDPMDPRRLVITSEAVREYAKTYKTEAEARIRHARKYETRDQRQVGRR